MTTQGRHAGLWARLLIALPGAPVDTLTRVSWLPSLLRMIHYPHDASAADAPGIGAHTDCECFALLRCLAPGLEVMNQAGAWIDAPPPTRRCYRNPPTRRPPGLTRDLRGTR